MNNEQFQGQLQQLQGRIKETWGRLTDDDITLVAGQRDKLLGRLQETYGISREVAHQRVQELERACNPGQPLAH